MKKQSGLSILGAIMLIAILVLALSVFNIRLKDIVESPAAEENIGYIKDKTKEVWEKYLEKPVSYIWNDIWTESVWQNFIEGVKRAQKEWSLEPAGR